MKKVIHNRRAKLFAEIVAKTGSTQSVIDCAMQEIESLREQVEFWQKEAAGRRDDMANYTRIVSETIDRLNVEVPKLTKERNAFQDQCIRLKNERAVEKEQLAALAEQNEKVRKALTKWQYLDSSYNWRCGYCGNEEGGEHKEGCALSLPNLATPVLNRLKAEAYREAADIVQNIDVYTFVHGGSSYDDGGITLSSAATAIRAKADALEKENL